MIRTALLLAAACLLMAAPAEAQTAGGGGGGAHGGRRGGGGREPSTAPKPAAEKALTDPADKPANQVEIVGVITAIDTAQDRVTIAYEPVEELNWSKGIMPFPVSKADLLTGRKVGEKVRFRLDSHEIYDLRPY